MQASENEQLRHAREFDVKHCRLRMAQIETVIAEFDRMCADLGQQIEAEEAHTRISDPAHFAYSTLAKAARERRAKLQRSADALKIELYRLQSAAGEAAAEPIAA